MMIQWLQSKLALVVAGLILISSLTTMFYLHVESMEREELKNRCRKISGVIEEIDNIDTEVVRQRISFDEDTEAFYLAPEIGGEPYTIEIYGDFVKLERGSRSVTSGLNAEVHLWNPEQLNDTGTLTRDEEDWRDSRADPLEIEAGEGNILVRKLQLDDGGSTRSHLFVSEVDIN